MIRVNLPTLAHLPEPISGSSSQRHRSENARQFHAADVGGRLDYLHNQIAIHINAS
jgi:hypothetical protein